MDEDLRRQLYATPPPEFVAALLEQGVRTYAVGPGRVRAVWHLYVDDAGTDAAVDEATALLRSRAA